MLRAFSVLSIVVRNYDALTLVYVQEVLKGYTLESRPSYQSKSWMFACSKIRLNVSSTSISRWLAKNLFGTLCNGTYAELGVVDGISASNTLLFYTQLNWSDILIEPTISGYHNTLKNRQRDFVVNAVVCDKLDVPLKMTEKPSGVLSVAGI